MFFCDLSRCSWLFRLTAAELNLFATTCCLYVAQADQSVLDVVTDNQAGTDPIYPDWWYSTAPGGKQRQDQQKQPKAQRPPPRLAYSQPAPIAAGRQVRV